MNRRETEEERLAAAYELFGAPGSEDPDTEMVVFEFIDTAEYVEEHDGEEDEGDDCQSSWDAYDINECILEDVSVAHELEIASFDPIQPEDEDEEDEDELDPELVAAAHAGWVQEHVLKPMQEQLAESAQDPAYAIQAQVLAGDGFAARLEQRCEQLAFEVEVCSRGFLSSQLRAHSFAPQIADDPRSRFGSEPTPRRQGRLS